MHYDRWKGQWVGQAVDAAAASSSAAADIPGPDAAAGAASDITSANYQNALNQIQSQVPATPSTSTSLSPTTLVIGGIAVLGLLWLLARK